MASAFHIILRMEFLQQDTISFLVVYINTYIPIYLYSCMYVCVNLCICVYIYIRLPEGNWINSF